MSLGIIPAFGGTQRLIRAVGHQKAAELLLRSSIITAEEALRIGLINSVVGQDQVLKVASEMACEISTKSPVAVRLIMDVLINSQNEGFGSGLALEAAVACLTLSSAESKELLRKFTERVKGR